MNKNYNLKLDLQFRCNNSVMKFNQFDNNTSDFFMRITNGGKLIDIEKAIVVLATIKPSGKVSSQFVEVENGLVYADLKPSMKDEVGIYTAKAMLILEDERVVTDPISYEVEEDEIFSLLNDTVEVTGEFTMLTDMLSRLSTIEISEEQRMINEAERILAEENRKIEEAKRVEAELIRQHEEADRAKYDATRESNENIRKQNESIRLANETNRIDEEAKRVEEENKRKLAEEERNANYNFMTEDEERRRSEANAHKEAEALRVQAETDRVNEEAKRRTTEQARVSAENTRVNNENTREANEVARKNNETKRIESETQRQNRYNSFIADAEANANNFENYTNTAKVKEEERKSNELDRKSQEDRRVSNEVERISNENTRKANEVAREKNEASRQDVFENKVSEVDEKISELNTTKENFVSSINTKVDNKISELDSAKSDMTNTVSNKVNEVEARFNALTSSQQQDAEVIDARDGETSLKARLDRDIEKAKQVYVNVEGSNISTDSSVGYLKDVEILGNTIQDASNLADIRSVGDKVEGQELYEIDVISYGKNLFDGYVETGWVDGSGNLIDLNRSRTNLIKVNPNIKYVLSSSSRFQFRVVFYTVNNVYISETVNTCDTKGMIFTTPTNCKYVRFMYAETVENSTSWKIQLEEGTVATPYEPYQEDKLTILSPVQLEKVGDIADRIIEKDGVWGVEKNVVRYNFPYELNWAIENSLTNSNRYCIVFKDLIGATDIKPSDLNSLSPIICDKYTTKKVADLLNIDEEGIGISLTALSIRINNNRLLTLDANGVNKLIAKEGLMILYQTAQPVFIPLPHDQQVKLRTFANKTNISFLTEIEGTIKAQVPKSLGATVNAHTEQINNLNKELDRVKKLEESTVSTVTTESDFTTVEATSNGYFEDVKLEGKTLVNHLLNSENTVSSTNATIKNYVGLQAGKTYTIVVYVIENNNNKPFYPFRVNYSDNVQLSIPQSAYPKGSVITRKFELADKQIISMWVNWCSTYEIGDIITTKTLLLEGDHTQNPPSYFEGLKSVGDGSDGILVESVNSDSTQSDKKPLLYYNNETQAWEKPILRQWDSIEKHSDGKYYYHQRSGEVVLNGSESWYAATSSNEALLRFYTNNINNAVVGDVFCDKFASILGNKTNEEGIVIWSPSTNFNIIINKSKLSTQDVQGFKQWLQANNVTVVYQLAQEKVYECTNIDLITYANETNYIVECGAIVPRSTLKVHNNISNVVSLLQKKVSLLESNVKASQEIQDMMILETDMRMLDIELALMDFVPMKLNLGGSNMLRSATYFNFLKNHIINETYEKEYLENVMNKYLATGRINQDEYDELYKMLYPPVYDIELPIEY